MKTDTEAIINLISGARKGHLVLPEFQRSFIWDRQAIEELLVSILNNYFIGTLLLLDVAPQDFPFKARKIEGIEDDQVYPKRMVLDGQQRLTSVHYALFGPDLPLKNTSYPYRFFLDLEKALATDWDEAVFSWPTYWHKTGDLFEDRQLQYDQRILSFAAVRDWPTWQTWRDGYRDFCDDHERDLDRVWMDEVDEIVRTFLNFQVALVELPQGTPLEMVVEIFERINRTGESLSVFELLTARLWKHDINLRNLWKATLESHPLIDAASSDKGERYPKFALQVVALLRGEECKRKNLIMLEGENFEQDWETANTYIAKSLQRLQSTAEGGYGVIPVLSLPYSTLVPPLAMILHEIEANYRARPDVYSKMHHWYWSSVFTERYGGSTDTLTQRDYVQMKTWMENDDQIPEAIVRDPAEFQRDLHEVVRMGAVYKGILCLVALGGARDFFSGDAIALQELDDHHIFPKSYLRDQGYEPDERNTILNRTLIARDTNRNFIRNRPPSDYVAEMEDLHGVAGTEHILATHFIDADAYAAMKNDDYEAFLTARESTITAEIAERCIPKGDLAER
jgi:hypothetical protein